MSSEITPERLEELLAAATPGPWAQHLVDETLVTASNQEVATTYFGEGYDEHPKRKAADAALIALSPALAARVIELEAENARLREALSAAIGYMTNAAIDLETGAKKRTALDTINGGIARARPALETPNAE